MYRSGIVGLVLLTAGCQKAPAPSTDNQGAPAPEVKGSEAKGSDAKGGEGKTPGPAAQPSRVVVSGWAVENVTVTPREGDYVDKAIEIKDTPTSSHPFTISPHAGNRLVVLECKLTPVEEDGQALDTFSARRKAVFGYGDETFRFLSGDGSLTAEHRKKLTGKYRMFDMERVTVTDPAGKSHKPLWCIAPEAEFTFIFTRGAGGDFLEKWLTRNPELIPAAGRVAARTNANRGLKTDGSFVSLMEVNQPVNLSVLYEVPKSVQVDKLKLVVEGGTPVAVRAKK